MAALELHVAVGGEDKVFPLVETEVRLGRGAENDIVLPDSSVSRQHAVLRFEDDSWFVYDLDSTNGVIVNRVKVLRERVVAG
ncbi:MAG: FHA domain-containing protein, partial [Acidobacteriota bacterium]